MLFKKETVLFILNVLAQNIFTKVFNKLWGKEGIGSGW